MIKFLQFCFYIACMLGMVFLIVSGVLGGFKGGWRYMRTLVTHIAFLAAAGIVVAAFISII